MDEPARGRVEHPLWNGQCSAAWRLLLESAVEDRFAAFVYCSLNGNVAVKPGMEGISKNTKLGNMGLVSFGSTTKSARTRATGVKRRRRSITVARRWRWRPDRGECPKRLIGKKCVVDKLMDGSVDNPMDNLVPRLPTGCHTGRPRAYPQRFNWITSDSFYILNWDGSCLDRGVHFTPSEVSGERVNVQTVLHHIRWQTHCRGLYELPLAA